MEITPDQLRAARALLHLEQSDLAHRANVSIVTIRRLEGAQTSSRVSSATLAGVRQALEQAGAEFIPGGVRRHGVTKPDRGTLYNDLRAISLRSAERLKDRELLHDVDLYDEDGLPA